MRVLRKDEPVPGNIWGLLVIFVIVAALAVGLLVGNGVAKLGDDPSQAGALIGWGVALSISAILTTVLLVWASLRRP